MLSIVSWVHLLLLFSYNVSKTVILRRYFESPGDPSALFYISRLKMLHGVNRRYVRESLSRGTLKTFFKNVCELWAGLSDI